MFVITPFRDIVVELRKLADQRLPPGARKQVGTVHTTQGKEADIVILVLGTAADQDGSREWASKTPNLLNVAVTRARRRLVVIGDHPHWSQNQNFRVLAQRETDGLLTVVDAAKWLVASRHDGRQAKLDALLSARTSLMDARPVDAITTGESGRMASTWMHTAMPRKIGAMPR